MEVYLRIKSVADVQRIVDGKVEESSGLEYKRELWLQSDTQKRELLKDLSGMGNGGGGTVLFGVNEDPSNIGIPTVINRLKDATLQGRLEDIVRSGIRPPLIATPFRVSDDAGYVLVVHIWPSPLGPYMVEGYGERRYYHRNGKSTVPMSEQQVRDAYLLAARGRERRPEVWRRHELPIEPEGHDIGPWLTVSAIPEEPLTPVLDLSTFSREHIAPPSEIQPSARFGGVEAVLGQIGVWADGVYGQVGRLAFRLHRDGAVGFGALLDNTLQPFYTARVLHGQIMYAAWLWEKLGVRTPVELHIRMRRMQQATLPYRQLQTPGVQRPMGVGIVAPPEPAGTTVHMPWEFERARVRNMVVWEFLQRLHHAFGLPEAPVWLFKEGWLYARGGGSLSLGLHEGAIFDQHGNLRARVYDDGHIDRPRDAQCVAHVKDGVVIDRSGDTLGVAEMALGPGLPDDFKPQSHTDPRTANLLPLNHAQVPLPMPAPTGRWSQADLATLLPL